MILARTLRRTIALRGRLPDDCIAFLRTDPQLPAPTERTDVVEIEPRDDGLLCMRCPWRPEMIGSARSLTRALDIAIYQLAAADEGATLRLNASLLRVGEARLLLVAEPHTDLSELIVALLVEGAAFEGSGLVFVRPSGIVAHPAKPRLRLERLAAAGLMPMHGQPALLQLDPDEAYCAIEPRVAGVEWTLREGPVSAFLLIERNDGGSSAMTRLRFDVAFSRLMQRVRSTRRPGIHEFVSFRARVELARTFRLIMGGPISAAALIRAQLSDMIVDE